MKKPFYKEIEIPEGVQVKIQEDVIFAEGPEGKNQRKFNLFGIDFEKKDDKIVIGKKIATKKDKRIINTTAAHIKNLLKGVKEKFVYKLKVCSSHFPITVEINGREVVIKNFLGEKEPRKCTLPEEIEAKKEGDIIIVSSYDKEKAGQAAAILETATKIKKRDRRVFQDGIYIIEKAGRKI